MESEVARCLEAGADLLHLDFMDGHFVPNLSFGFPITKALAQSFPEVELDVHLMVENPDTYLDRLAELGCYQVSVHWETCPHLHRTLGRIRELGMKAGVAFNPHTPLNGLKHVSEFLDNVLIMTVNPGFGGQSFIESTVSKIESAHKLVSTFPAPVTISVDGGVNAETGALCRSAGATLLVAGSYLFKAPDMSQAVEALR